MGKAKKKHDSKVYKMCGLNPQQEQANIQALVENAQKALPLSKSDKDEFGYGSGYGGNGYITNYAAGKDWNGGITTYVKKCEHDGSKIVFESGGKKLYGSSGFKLDEYSGKWDLIIDLASNVRSPTPIIKPISNHRFDVLKSYCYRDVPPKSEVLGIDWLDQQAPPVTLDFWIKLWEMLPEKTVIACVGGHGRTGTCIAALIIATGVDYYTAVETVRTDYCTSAIESLAQEKYLHELYMTMLEGALKVETDPKEKLDIQEDLLYAKAHKPNARNSYGLEPKEVEAKIWAGEKDDKVVYPDVTQPGKSVIAADYEEDGLEDYKEENGKAYYKVCVDPKCWDKNCLRKSHMGWVCWDDLDKLEAGDDRDWGL